MSTRAWLTAGAAVLVTTGFALLSSGPASFDSSPAPLAPYDVAETESWREEREAALRSPDGWLSIAGFFLLKDGANTVGSDPSSDIRLPAGGAPPYVGRLVRHGAGVRFEPAPEAALLLDGAPLDRRVELSPRNRLQAGRITFHLHASGARVGVRVRDPESEILGTFGGVAWYPVDEGWRLAGRYIPYEEPRPVPIVNVLGDVEEYTSPGEVQVKLRGQNVRLQPLTSGDRLWFIFSDGAAGAETYPIRFLYADAPSPSGGVVLDFNRAYNAPCAYNPFTTCPLPPAANRLEVRVAAGERLPP
jgi:uncharacterized protein